MWGGRANGRLSEAGKKSVLFENNAELLEQAKGVRIEPVFLNLAVRDTEDAHPGHGDLLPRRRDPHQVPCLRATNGHASCHSVPFGKHVLDGVAEVGGGGVDHT